jgi:hypothetical protein
VEVLSSLGAGSVDGVATSKKRHVGLYRQHLVRSRLAGLGDHHVIGVRDA